MFRDYHNLALHECLWLGFIYTKLTPLRLKPHLVTKFPRFSFCYFLGSFKLFLRYEDQHRMPLGQLPLNLAWKGGNG
jgi:hypothetical protein